MGDCIGVIFGILSVTLTVSGSLGQLVTATTASSNTGGYITANDFVIKLLQGAKIRADNDDYWEKTDKMGLIPSEVKKDNPLLRAQASYIFILTLVKKYLKKIGKYFIIKLKWLVEFPKARKKGD
ncbi:hypothetical protein OTK01_000730 [Caldicellulosiruptor acetigenus]|uniref:hypothetical protein n=1 Tax=Caldicellulosiruptor acetigenus TaxID=301953 RepID=UPI0004925973|nr:hypothetical protein [Caldicellulosiruptor acetigenus]WAM36925.1 hypothetical protein OTK01_000730 [Caldicellulosiruptor acetigenus]